MSSRKVFASPAIKASKMRGVIERGEFVAWMLREKRISRSIRRGLPSAKTIGRRLKAISMQLRGVDR